MNQSFISLEVRVLLETGTKTFCSCKYRPDGTADTCAVCRKEADAIPALNGDAAYMGYLIAQALDCTLIKEVLYERFSGTPELPPGYALSHVSAKIAVGGYIDCVFHKKARRISIKEIRIEEDAGRLTHSGSATRMDYSHAGMPSLRIVTEPDIEIGEEAEVFLRNLRRSLQYLGIDLGLAPENAIRCNAHVAVGPSLEDAAASVKLRNLNSFNFVRKSINYEIARQDEILENGGTVLSESRLWNETKNITESFQKRKNENKNKYNLIQGVPPFIPEAETLDQALERKIELPEHRRSRFMKEYGLSMKLANTICDERLRADFFENTVACGADPVIAANWIATDILKILKREDMNLDSCPLTPTRLAQLITLVQEKRIHSKIAKQTLQRVFYDDKDPIAIIQDRKWEQITDKEVLKEMIDGVLAAYPKEVEVIRSGDSRPMQFMIGQIMNKTSGLAEPGLVREIFKETLDLSFVFVLSMGGAITGVRLADGVIVPGDEHAVRALLDDEALLSKVRYEDVSVGRLFSEETAPEDWASLIVAIAAKLASGNASGIVITHGTDTLSYTAALMYWLFPDATAPIVLTASSKAPGESPEAKQNLQKAIRLAIEKTSGVYVVMGDRVLSPLNLKFERAAPEGFRNWNLPTPLFSGTSLVPGILDADKYVLTQLLEDAVNQIYLCRVYPGMRGDFLVPIINAGVKYIILELYDTGTASLRDTPYSLKSAFEYGKKHGVRFFCTSQQESIVDFSQYITAHRIWKEGAVPMGNLTTESVFSRYLAASLIAESEDELMTFMEGDAE